MATQEIDDFTTLTTPASGDLLPIVDVSDTTDSPQGTTKKIAVSDLVTGAPPAAHATEHQNGGSDEISVTGLSGLLADPQTPSTHAHTSSDVSDFAEAVEDKIGTKVVAGTGISVAYNDTTGETEITNADPGSGATGAPAAATYITQTADAGLSNEFAMGSLATGIVKNTTTTGVPSIATATDIKTPLYAVDAVGSDAYAITLSPAISSYTDGLLVAFRAATANTGGATLAIDGLTAKAIVKSAGGLSTALDTNDIRASQIVIVQYSSVADNFQMQSTLGNAASGGGATINSTDTVIPYRSNSTTFADSPLSRADANTIEQSNGTSATSVRYNLYGLKNGANLERFSIYYDSVNSKYVFSSNKGGTGTLRNLEIEMDGTAFWRFRTDGKIYGLDNSASIISVGQGTASVPGLQFGNAGSSTGFFSESGPYLSVSTNAATRASFHDFGLALNASGRYGWPSGNLSSSKTEDTALERGAAGRVDITDGASHNLRDLKVRQHYVDATMTNAGTTGAQTINKSAGSVNFAAAATSLVVTNNLVTATSIVLATIQTDDATATSVKAIPASGSFTLKLDAAATAETKVAFLVINK
jgi:hypothetical protein